jgi:peptidoglycan hydrolase-like protein with peptidoglycan-binding domain
VQSLIDADLTAERLARGRDSDDVRALQQLLHLLGYDAQLQWERYGADGDYGGGTTRAVQALAHTVELPSTGAYVSKALARRIVDDVAPLLRAAPVEAAASSTSPATPADTPTATAESAGADPLRRGNRGPAVADLQIRLAGFRGTVWDGDFGAGTELQVLAFQRDYMGVAEPDGVVDADTRAALDRFADEHRIDVDSVKCPCGVCDGFGQGRFAGEYRDDKPHIEAYHRREYPGVHRAILHAYRAAAFYLARYELGDVLLTSGYRCWVRNEQRGRTSTNHMGKALDCDFPAVAGEDKRDDQQRCDRARAILVDKCGFQICWSATDRKALEPANIAPTWIHMDVRCYRPRYLTDGWFVSDAESPA